MNYRKTIITATLMFSTLFVFAQSSYNFSLKEAQEHALEHNRSLKNASLEIKKAEAARWQVLATMLPQVNVNLDYSNYMGYELDFGIAPGMTIPMNPEGNLAAQVGLAFGGAQIVGTQISKLAKQMAEISYQKSEQQIDQNVKSIYFSILAMEETVTLLDLNLENIKQLQVFTENSVKVGVAEQTDADQLQVQVATMETGINSTKRGLEMLYNSMRLFLGIGVNSEIILTDSMDNLLTLDKSVQLIESEFVLENNFDYRLLEESTHLAKKQVTLSLMNYIPTITGFYQYTQKTYFGKDQGFNMTPPNLVGASISIPIFSSGVNYNKYQEAKINYEIQTNTFDDTKDALNIQHRQLRYDLISALETYETQKNNVEVNQRILNNTSKKYEQGMASSLDLTTTGTNLINAQNSYVQALMSVVNAQIALEDLLNANN